MLKPRVSRAYWDEADINLTLTEFNIVRLLASNVGNHVTYRAVYDCMHHVGFIAGSGENGYRTNVRSSHQAHSKQVPSSSIPSSPRSRTTRHSVTAGESPRTPQRSWLETARRLGASLTLKLVGLVGIFIALPIVLYSQFESADRQMRDLVTRAIQDRSKLIGHALTPVLRNAEPERQAAA